MSKNYPRGLKKSTLLSSALFCSHHILPTHVAITTLYFSSASPCWHRSHPCGPQHTHVVQLQRYGYPRPTYVVTTISYTNLGSHKNTLMALIIPLKPSQHSRRPLDVLSQPLDPSQHFCGHHPTIVAITTNLLVLSKW